MPYPDFRELSVANIGSNLRPRAATRDLRASLTSLGGIKVETRNTYVGKGAEGDTAPYQEARANHLQRQLGSTGNHIRVFPAVAEFKDTEPNVTHMLTITVVNRSDHVKTIRFVPPKLKQFALHQIPSMPVAPGLEVSADLEYFSQVDGDYVDEIIVMCESDRIKVPIYSYAPRAELFFDSYCLFGAVPPSSTNIRYVDVVNRGKKAADFEFLREDAHAFTVEPMVGRLGQDGSDDCFIRVKVTFSPSDELGLQRAICQVKVNGQIIGEPLDLSALVARQVLELVSPEGSGKVPSLQFGTVYIGETRDIQVTLVNDGPEPAHVTSIVHRQDIHENDEPFWTIEPAETQLQPFEQRLLNVTYHPPPIPITQGFKEQLKLAEQREDHEVAANFSGTMVSSRDDLLANIRLIGRAITPEVTLSQFTVEFIDTPTNEHTEIAIRIRNHSDELPIVFDTKNVAHFRARPAKGRLLPYQSLDLVISFVPAQMGMHKSVIPFYLYGSTGQKVGMVDLRVLGNCTSEGKKALVGGPAATDDTFKPKFAFQAPDHLHIQKTAPPTKWQRDHAWRKFPPVVDDNTIAYTFEAERFDEIRSNEDKYLRWLRRKHAERIAAVSDAEGLEFALGNRVTGVACGDDKKDPDYAQPSLDLGLFGLPAKGLPKSKTMKEPTLHLPVADEPLYLKHRPGEGPTYIKPKSKPMDENRLMLNKFKPHPTTKRERQECSSFLNPKQIMQIATHPPKMDFGPVCIQSDISKSFTISNGTTQSLSVRVDIHDNKALEKSKPETQIIPSGATAGFDITLYLEASATVDTKVTYVINEHHSFHTPVTAQAVPVMLNMSRAKINFAFAPRSNSMLCPETLYFINPSNNLAEFQIEGNANFVPLPATGTVEPMSQEEVTIFYKPMQETAHEASLTVNVIGGASMTLQCIGEADEGNLESKPRSMDFGSVAAGTSAKKSITLAAKGNNMNIFFVDPDELKNRCPGLSVVPDKGMIPPGGTMQLIASVKATKPVKIDSFFVVQVRGGKNIKVPVKCRIDVPTVKIKQDEINFGGLYLGATEIVPLNIENTSEIPAIFTLDLHKHPEFGARVPEDLEYDEEDTERTSEIEAALPETARVGPRVKFCVAAKSEGCIELTYSPETIGQQAFELPLSLLGVSGKESKELRRAVVGEANKPRLLLSTPSVEFAKRIVISENMPNFNYSLEITLTNCDDEHCLVDARLEGDEVAAGVFKMTDTTTDLAPERSVTLKILFMPRADGDFRCKLRIYTDSYFNEPYFDLFVTGVGIYPSLGFDRREVFMPVTPLGQKSTVCFEVINYGYDNLNLKHALPVDASTVPMTIDFPNGTMINVVNSRLPVEVTFSAKKSMSFATKIDFFDHNGNKYSVPIIGTTDASLLTVFPFLTLHEESVALKGGERPPYLSINGPIRAPYYNEDGEIEMESGISSPHNGKIISLMPPNSEFLCECKVLTEPSRVKTLLDWANLVIFRTSVVNFPGDFLEARGKHIIDVIEASTGKTVPGQIKKVPANRKEEGQMLLNQYAELLSTLKAYGGLVHAIKPEYLLPQDLFHKLYLERGGLPVELRPFYQAHFPLVLEGAWMMLMYQVVKLFVFNRLTPKLLKSTPGIDPALTKSLYLTGSNVYSPSELVLLGWLTYHLHVTSPKSQVLNFDKDMHDGRVFAAAISGHVPSLAPTLSVLKKTDVLQEKIANQQQIINACRKLGLEYCPPPTQLAQAPARDMILFAVYLFNALPPLIPRATISFDGRLNDAVIKHIELTNPSSKPLVYSIRIDGCKEFTCADSLKIGARDKIKFPVNCFHKTRGSAKAQIFFLGERVAGGSAGVTLVFDVESSVKTFKRTQVLVKETKLYEQIAYEIPVKNLDAEKDTMLNITLVPLNPARGANRSASPKRGSMGGASKNAKVTSSHLLPDMTFWVKVPSIKLKRKASNVIKINFVALQLCGHSCLVFIMDDLVGETCYELQAKVDLPSQTDSNKFQHQMKSTVVKDVPISLRNTGIDKCRTGVMELMGPQGKDWFRTVFEQALVEYKVEYLTECFSGPKVFTLWGPNAQASIKAAPATGRPQLARNNKLPLELRPMGPGKYEGRMILRSSFDVRILDVEATITAMGTRAELTFSCPARQAISQDIPIINHSDTPWVIQSQLSGDYFSGPKEFQVPPMNADGPGTAFYTLTFAPAWIAGVQGMLTLRNQTIGDSYQYELTGVGEDPVAEGHQHLQCTARKRTHETILVRNIFGDEDVEYTVECDLLGISGSATFFVPAGVEAEYDLTVMMPRGGEFTGSISFKTENGEYIWYTIEVKAENPAAERDIRLEAKARTAIIADIPITNPLNETVTFDVMMEGEGLIGAPQITIGPGQDARYELIYSPLLPTNTEGKLMFVNMEMGEFWYLLFLDAAEADDIVCEPVQAELGKTATIRLQIENPVPEDIELELTVSNPLNFRVDYVPKPGATFKEDLIEVEAYHEAAFDVIYTPTALGEVEETIIELFHPIAGKWVYRASGHGFVNQAEEPPWLGKGVVQMETVHVSATVFQTSSNLLNFKNPFNRHLTVQLKLHCEPEEQEMPLSRHEEEQPFRILLAQRTMHLHAFQEIDVAYLFCPVKMEHHTALLEFDVVEIDQRPLSQDEGFCFVYPIQGTAEAPGSVNLGRFATRARERLESALELNLSGVGSIQLNEKIELEVVTTDEHKQMLAKSLMFHRDHQNREGQKQGIVRYNMAFEPLKAMRTKVLLKVSLQSGGRWVFELDLVANDAEVDDVIRIEGALNQKRSVTFQMTNQFNERAAFNAYFTPDTSAEFSVKPEIGVLEPYSSGEGTKFELSFTPTSYGKLYKGKLVVETEEMQWCYEVHGDHPKYQVPKNSRAKVDTQIHPELDPDVYKGRHQPHKYLRENVETLKEEQKKARLRTAAGAQ